MYIRRAGACRRKLAAAATRLLYRFLLNKWYFDELYDAIFVRPAQVARPLLLEGRRRPRSSTASGPTASRPASSTSPRGVVRLQTGYRLSLRLRDAARRRGARHLVSRVARVSTDVRLRHPHRSPDPAARRRGLHPDAARRRARRRSATPAGSRSRTTLVTFLLSLVAWGRFDPADRRLPARREPRLVRATTIRFKLGVDGISMLFVLLTTFLMPFCILALVELDREARAGVHDRLPGARDADDRRLRALDLVLFYLFFEGGLIPMFLIIGIWGGKRRVYATFKFFLYTLLGSVLMLLAILAMYWHAGTTDIPTLLQYTLPAAACRPGCGSPSSPPSR